MKNSSLILCLVGLLAFAPTFVADAKPKTTKPASKKRTPKGADAAMVQFLNAVKQGSKTKFLSFISRSQGIKMYNTNSPNGSPKKISYAQLVRNLASKEFTGEYYNYHFFLEKNSEYDQADTLRTEVSTLNRGAWIGDSQNKFIPKKPFDRRFPNSVFVKWRLEKGKWVVESIGTPRI